MDTPWAEAVIVTSIFKGTACLHARTAGCEASADLLTDCGLMQARSVSSWAEVDFH